MTNEQNDVAQAEADAKAARERLSRDVAQLQERLDPKTMVRDAREKLTDRGLSVAETAKRNPAPFAGAAALIGFLLFRKPIARLFRRKNPAAAKPHYRIANTSTLHQSGEGSS